MSRWEEPESAALDTYVRIQLARAAEAYTLHVDMAARLEEILEAGRENERDDTTTASS